MNIQDVKKLSQVISKHGLCVSLYLNIDKKHQDRHDLKTILNHLINEEEKNLSVDHDAKKHLRADEDVIWNYVNKLISVTPSDRRGVAIFTNSEMGFFHSYLFTRPIENRIFFSTKYLVRPLLRYLDDNARVLAAFVDKARGRLVEIDEGIIKKFIEFEDVVPNKVKAGTHYGLADKRIERHVDWHISNHLKKIAKISLNLLKRKEYDWLFIFGQNNELTSFEKLLHSYPKEKLVFEEQVDLLEDGKERYLEKILEAIEKVKKDKHQEVNDELFEYFPHRSVLGLEDVNYELDRKSVFKLILSNRFSRVYPVCGKCDYLVHEQLTCPKCGADLTLIDWESNELVGKTLFQNAEIHFIDSPSLEEKGGIGGILRYEAVRKAT